jgi:hypothetical protein
MMGVHSERSELPIFGKAMKTLIFVLYIFSGFIPLSAGYLCKYDTDNDETKTRSTK